MSCFGSTRHEKYMHVRGCSNYLQERTVTCRGWTWYEAFLWEKLGWIERVKYRILSQENGLHVLRETKRQYWLILMHVTHAMSRVVSPTCLTSYKSYVMSFHESYQVVLLPKPESLTGHWICIWGNRLWNQKVFFSNLAEVKCYTVTMDLCVYYTFCYDISLNTNRDFFLNFTHKQH